MGSNRVKCLRTGVDMYLQFNYYEGEWYDSYDMNEGSWIVILGKQYGGNFNQWLCRKDDFINIDEFRDDKLRELGI